jgi:hypothetical protein
MLMGCKKLRVQKVQLHCSRYALHIYIYIYIYIFIFFFGYMSTQDEREIFELITFALLSVISID